MSISNQSRSSDRRTEICEAALDLAAAGGSHAVTHEAIDQRLGVAPGLTSQYFRSHEMVMAAVMSHGVEELRRPVARWFETIQ